MTLEVINLLRDSRLVYWDNQTFRFEYDGIKSKYGKVIEGA